MLGQDGAKLEGSVILKWEEFFHFYGFTKKKTGFLLSVENQDQLLNINAMLKERRGEYDDVKMAKLCSTCECRGRFILGRFKFYKELKNKFIEYNSNTMSKVNHQTTVNLP